MDQCPPLKTTYRGQWLRAACIIIGIGLFVTAGWKVWQLVNINSNMEYVVVIKAVGIWKNGCFRYLAAKDVAQVFVLLFVGATLVARSKRTVLFLRRFGLDVNFVVSRTFERKLGAHFRLVTLDDERFPSRDLTAFERWSIRIAPPLIALTILAIGVPVAADFASHPGSNFAVGELSIEVQREIGFYVGIVWMAFVVFWAHTLATRRRSRLHVGTGRELAVLLSEVHRSRRWLTRLSFMAPAALVTKVSDELWQKCVCSLSEKVDAILVDVSKPTPNLQWEIDQMREAGLKCVFIAEKGHLKSWTSAAVATASKSPDSQVLCSLEHYRVLTYDGNERDGGNAFARSLQQLLTDAATSTPKRRRSLKISASYFRIGRFIRKALLWATLGFAAAYSGAVISKGAIFWQMQRIFGSNIAQMYFPQPLVDTLLDNDFVYDLVFFVEYHDVCEGYDRLDERRRMEERD